MKVIGLSLVALVLTGIIMHHAWAQDLIVFPAQDQSEGQMEKDKFACYNWAKGQSGFDPMQMPTASSPAPPKGDKSVGGSVVGGRLLGAAYTYVDLGDAKIDQQGGVSGCFKRGLQNQRYTCSCLKPDLAVLTLADYFNNRCLCWHQNPQSRKETILWQRFFIAGH